MGKISRIDGMYTSATAITANTTTASESAAIYVGVAGNYEFYVNGAWVHFKAVPAGTVLRVRATGARDQGDSTAPAAGEIVFLS